MMRLWGVSAAAIVLLPAFVAWTDHVASEGDVIAANVVYEGTDLSGVTVAAAAAAVEERAARILRTPFTIETGGDPIVATAAELGFSYDYDRALTEIVTARHSGGPIGVFLDWLSSPFSTVTVGDTLVFDPQSAAATLTTSPLAIVSPAVEPSLTMDGTNYLYLVPGQQGREIDVDGLVDRISRLDPDSGPRVISADLVSTFPSVTDRYAEEVADHLNALTADGIEVILGSQEATLTTAQTRRHLKTSVSNGAVRFEFDVDGLLHELERVVPGPVGDFQAPMFDIVDGDIVVLEGGTVPPVCCDLASVRHAAEGILAGGKGPWALTTRLATDPELIAWADGSLIVDKVSEFTTSHSCCQPRVTNIQRMADLVRGAYLVPGQQMSLNRRVPRTRANGFVADGAIRFGHLTEEIGGGVSQFATTLFNAAYFAGLDFAEYRSHSIYFKRYPFGREATISNPKPDLVLVNNTDYPLLIWTTYDSRNITVTMYSTKHVEVVELGQRVAPEGQCTFVQTDRERTYPDGRVIVDTVEATYRPEEGFDCNGLPVDIPELDEEGDAEEEGNPSEPGESGP